jgi:hypothetical protein
MNRPCHYLGLPAGGLLKAVPVSGARAPVSICVMPKPAYVNFSTSRHNLLLPMIRTVSPPPTGSLASAHQKALW